MAFNVETRSLLLLLLLVVVFVAGRCFGVTAVASWNVRDREEGVRACVSEGQRAGSHAPANGILTIWEGQQPVRRRRTNGLPTTTRNNVPASKGFSTRERRE